jgi:hypothetical protein
MPRDKFEHEYICYQCARDKEAYLALKEGGISGEKCNYCNGRWQEKDEILYPWYNYNWPRNKDAQYIALQKR